MTLTYISRFQFKTVDDKLYSLPAYGDGFWQKYLDVFDKILVIGEPVKEYLDNGSMVPITDERIRVEIIKSIESPRELKNLLIVRKDLCRIINNSEAVLIKPASNKGIIAIRICEKLNMPYMIEMTGDVQSALKVRRSLIMKAYSDILYKRTITAIRNCQFGLYVTEGFLQRKYPIRGEMCGCTDTLLPETSSTVLEERIKKIEAYIPSMEFQVGLIGFYHDNNKGIDTAIDAIGVLQTKYNMSIMLTILGVGSSEDREKWFKYSMGKMKENTLCFSPPLPGPASVVKWIDSMDLVVLPSRSEGFPRAIAETMSRGCPTITSDVCGLSEMVEAKWQHKPEDYMKLSELINMMLNSKNAMSEAAHYNFEKAKRYYPDTLQTKRNEFLNRYKMYCDSIRR